MPVRCSVVATVMGLAVGQTWRSPHDQRTITRTGSLIWWRLGQALYVCSVSDFRKWVRRSGAVMVR